MRQESETHSQAGQKSGHKVINLALQGGGSHGAFAWGALDRILEDERIVIEGIVGTSAGAMNAAVTAYGLTCGGNAGARQALARFWKAVADVGAWSIIQPSALDRLISPGSLDYSPGWVLMDMLSRVWSPYQMNPANYNPLREILENQIDFDTLSRSDKVKLFVCASNVFTNRLRVFDLSDISVDGVIASACIPSVFQAVEIDGEFYWDGGYMGNPPIFPIIYNSVSTDVLLIMVNPIHIEEVPNSAQAILDRINTLSFNSSLMREMRAINFVNRLVESGFDDGGRLKRMLIHCIDAEDEMSRLGVSSKLNVSRDFLTWLFELGRERADVFLRDHFDTLGKSSSTSIEQRFL
ncbi:MAG TPA: patatin-like phospholipase family protein [Blastocatellia bacterium]|nr:patatin-like phospholipase family protein [Blastocatellia bacterium]